MNAILQTAVNTCINEIHAEGLFPDFGEMVAELAIYEEVEMPHNNVMVIDGKIEADIVQYVKETYYDPEDYRLVNYRFTGTISVYEMETDKDIFEDTLTLNLNI